MRSNVYLRIVLTFDPASLIPHGFNLQPWLLIPHTNWYVVFWMGLSISTTDFLHHLLGRTYNPFANLKSFPKKGRLGSSPTTRRGGQVAFYLPSTESSIVCGLVSWCENKADHCMLWISLTGIAYDKFDRDCVREHNRLRTLHGTQPLAWSESVAADAQKWVEYLAQNDKIEHDSETLNSKDQGENIAWFTPPQLKCENEGTTNCVTCTEIVTNWYNEVQNYNFQEGSSKNMTLPVKHFAQVDSYVIICCELSTGERGRRKNKKKKRERGEHGIKEENSRKQGMKRK